MELSKYLIKPNKKINLADYSTDSSGKIKSKEQALSLMEKNIKKMAKLQDKLYADDRYALLLIFQAMDAAGKDSAIKHVMSGLNPQGTQVYSFKQPSAEELDHDYLWRINKSLPERGRIGIFNRSHYEEVLVIRVHDAVSKQKIHPSLIDENIWKNRYRQIRDFERYLFENGTITLKFFLHISKEEQRNRFLKRIEDPTKNWKFSTSDLKERALWNDYQTVYSEAISATSTKNSPWYVIPSDKKWFSRLVISEVIVKKLESLDISYPLLNDEQIKNLQLYKDKLMEDASVE
ncbi:MAG TPA: polyphosphate kinase 2 family protein [Ignavibacteriaceae bacterium]|nr:polyphosphate kinase 2 family protein [Ignavibacteriaceae bacterium]